MQERISVSGLSSWLVPYGTRTHVRVRKGLEVIKNFLKKKRNEKYVERK